MSEYSEGAQQLIDSGNLVGGLVMASMGATQEVTNQLLENLEYQNKVLEAELDLIREIVEDLCRKPWVPNPRDIINALYPSLSSIKAKMDSGKAES